MGQCVILQVQDWYNCGLVVSNLTTDLGMAGSALPVAAMISVPTSLLSVKTALNNFLTLDLQDKICYMRTLFLEKTQLY